MDNVVVMSERTRRCIQGLAPSHAEDFMDAACPDGWPENAEIVIDNTYPVGVVTIWERENYDRMLELQEAPPAELQRWIDHGESLRTQLT